MISLWLLVTNLLPFFESPLLIHMFSVIVKSGPGHRYFQEKEEERTGRQVSDTIRYSGGMIWINPLVSSEHDTLN